MADSIRLRVSRASSCGSGALHGSGNVIQPPGWMGFWNRSGSTVGSPPPASSSKAENGRDRDSRSARVFAVFVRMRKIQVLSDERPSKRPIPRSTPSHASWTTSSATAALWTKPRASRRMAPP